MSALLSWYARRSAAYAEFVGLATALSDNLEKGFITPTATVERIRQGRAALTDAMNAAGEQFDADLDKQYPGAVPQVAP